MVQVCVGYVLTCNYSIISYTKRSHPVICLYLWNRLERIVMLQYQLQPSTWFKCTTYGFLSFLFCNFLFLVSGGSAGKEALMKLEGNLLWWNIHVTIFLLQFKFGRCIPWFTRVYTLKALNIAWQRKILIGQVHLKKWIF